MSEWNERASAQKKVPGTPKKNAKQIIKPRVTLSDNPERFENWIRGLRDNNGQARAALDRLLDKAAYEIERVTVARHMDDSPAYIEVRTSTRPSGKDMRSKTYRTFYRADVSGSDDKRDDGEGQLAVGITPLAEAGLYVPVGAADMHDAAREARARAGLRPVVFWCEGDKTREAVEARLNSDYARDKFAELGYLPVAAASLGGVTGIRSTNYLLRPPPGVSSEFTYAGCNDVALELKEFLHYVVLDNDAEGRSEGMQLADKFEVTYGVPKTQIFIVEPPATAMAGWDDADTLPPPINEQIRIDQYLAAKCYDGWWEIKRLKGGGFEIDTGSIANRQRAMRLAGVSEAFLDTSNGKYNIKGPLGWAGHLPNETEIQLLAEKSIKIMGKSLSVAELGGWREPLNMMANDTKRDLIYEETMALVDAGRAGKTDTNRPENLFAQLFGLPMTPYLMNAGFHVMRDIVALRCLPAFEQDAVIPQLLYVFYGNEGYGKSTAVKVLSGGSPDPRIQALRYTDTVDFKDLQGSETHGDRQLYLKLAGMTAAEFADKPLGTNIKSNRADLLKSFTNKGSVEFRDMFETGMRYCNLRCIRIFTTNNPDILTGDMGSRRWVIIDVNQSQRAGPHAMREHLSRQNRAPTFEESLILKGYNPGLNWLADNFASMLAHVYDDGAWRDGLMPAPEMLALMGDAQQAYISQQNWELLLEDQLRLFEDMDDIMIAPVTLAMWAMDLKNAGSGAPTPREHGILLRRIGWEGSPQRVGEKKRLSFIWHKRGTTGRGIRRQLIWASATPSMPGIWRVVTGQSDEQMSALLAAQDAANTVPF